MTYDELVALFEEAKLYQKRANLKNMKADALRMSVLGRAITYDKPNVQTSPHNYVEDTLAEVADLESEAEVIMSQGDDLKARLKAMIEILESDEQQIVLIDYYFNGLSISDIADKRNFSKTAVWDIRNDALVNIFDSLQNSERNERNERNERE